jgi:DNA-binding NarL/FixJ family response regulator
VHTCRVENTTKPMSQWGVQLVIGKLLTDDEFRRRFEQSRRECLRTVCERGIDLTETEIAALLDEDPDVWSTMAARIDRRLHNAQSEVRSRVRQRSLTARELRVLSGVFEGLTNKQIAADLGISEGAVKATLQHLFRKTHVRTRAQLVRVALEQPLGATPKDR